jgi:7-keto-8-aminopelargonate synthetase-like enzyme
MELKKRFDALLLLDEAHAIGVVGPNGRGLAAEIGFDGEVDVQMGTLSKALGVSGGYICGSRSLVDWLINRARSFIYSTAPPPALAAAALAAVEFLASDEGEARRRLLWERIEELRKNLPKRKAIFANSESAIIPWMVGAEQAAMDLSRSLQSDGFFVPAVRYPTVAKGSARLRITVTATHQGDHIRSLCQAIKRLSA